MDESDESGNSTGDFGNATIDLTCPPPAPTVETRVLFGAMTHSGLIRPNNEDQYLIVRLRKSLELLATSLPAVEYPEPHDQIGYVMLVADGIGGRAGGERASALAVKGASRYLLGAAKWFFRLDDPDENVRLRLLREGLDRIDKEILDEAKAHPELAGMGTTLTAAGIIGTDVFIVHVGDSRVYALHHDKLAQVTTDHTLKQRLIDQGLMQPGQAGPHEVRGVLTNALGGKPGVEAQIVKLRLDPGDRLLLCTDGLSDAIPDDRIAELLKKHSEPDSACRALVDAALAAGGLDNVTVLVAAFGAKD